MRHFLISFLTVCALCAAMTVSSSAQTMYTTYSGFTVPETPVLPSAEKHPSLFFDTSTVAKYQQRRTAPGYDTMWNSISSEIKSFKSKTASSLDCSDRPLMAKYCAFGWIVNGDATAKAKAIEALMIAYTNVPRTATSADFDAPYDEIYRATWLQNYCEAYDWMQPSLTHAQDSTIRAAIAFEAVILRSNMVDGAHPYAPRPHNHRSKPAYALATAALTLSNDSRAADWLRFALQQINTVTKYQFSSDGIYREGPHYDLYAMVNAIPFLWQYKNVSGVDQFPYYKAAFEWPVLIRSQRGWMPNIEDSYVKPMPTHMVAAAYTTQTTRLHASEPLSKLLQWNWRTTQFFTKDYTGATNDAAWDIDEFLLYDSSIPTIAPSIDPTLRLASGQVMFRNGWVPGAQPSRYLIFHGVAAADNHDHPDELSYVMEGNNAVLATDAGYGADGSSDTKRAWYTSAQSHNIVTVDSIAPFDVATNVTPVDRHFVSAGWCTYSEKEAATHAPSGRLRRGIAMIDNNYWFVYDRGTGTSSATYKLYLHGRGTMTRTDRSVTWSVPADKYGSAARLNARIIGSADPAMTDHTDGFTSLFKDAVAQQYVEARQVKDTVLFGHLLLPAAAGTAMPVVNDWTDGSTIGCEVVTGTGVSDYFVVQKNSQRRTSGPFTTDALFAAATINSAGLTRFAASEATIFQFNGVEMMSSSAPVTLTYVQQNDTTIVCQADSIATPASVTLKVGTASSVTLNDSPIAFTVSAGGSVTFTVDRSGTIAIRTKRATSVGMRSEIAPTQLNIESVYPNPFNPSATIRFTVNRSGRATLDVFDIAGRHIAALVDRPMATGTYTCTWDAGSNPSGVYFFRLRTDEAVMLEKAMLIK